MNKTIYVVLDDHENVLYKFECTFHRRCTSLAKNSGTLKNNSPKFYIIFELKYMYIYAKYNYWLSFLVIPYGRKTSDSNIKKRKEQKNLQRQKVLEHT